MSYQDILQRSGAADYILPEIMPIVITSPLIVCVCLLPLSPYWEDDCLKTSFRSLFCL